MEFLLYTKINGQLGAIRKSDFVSVDDDKIITRIHAMGVPYIAVKESVAEIVGRLNDPSSKEPAR
jgi:hypothetical protein